MTPYIVLIEIKVVRSYVIKTLNLMINSLGYIIFTPRLSEVGKIQPFRRRKKFVHNNYVAVVLPVLKRNAL